MISDPEEALDLCRRVEAANATIARERRSIARITSMLRERKRRLAEAVKEREALWNAPSEDLPMFATPRQPAGLVAGQQPGAIAGCLTNIVTHHEEPNDDSSDPSRGRPDPDRVGAHGVDEPHGQAGAREVHQGAELVERDWEDPRAATIRGLSEELRPLMHDDLVDDSGEYTTPERIVIPMIRSLRCEAVVLLARGADGLWRGGYAVKARDRTGRGSMPGVRCVGHATKEGAIFSACKDIFELLVEREQVDAAAAVDQWFESSYPTKRKRKPKPAKIEE